MSKIRNLFKKFSKKNKNSQDSFEQEEEYEEIDQTDLVQENPEATTSSAELDDFEEYDEVGEETVIMDTNDPNNELLPHRSKPEESEVPSKDDLEFPQEIKRPVTQKETTDPPQENSNAPITPKIPTEEADSTPSASEEPSDQESTDAHEQYTEHTNTGTESIDLETDQISIKDRLDHLKTRTIDRFRTFNKKDLNKAYKTPKKPKLKIDLNQFKSSANQIRSHLPNLFFNRSNRQKIHHIFQLLILTIIVYGTAHLIGEMINPGNDYTLLSNKKFITFDENKSLTQNDVNEIKTANVFKTEQVKVKKDDKKPVINQDKVCLTASKKSSANVKLINTIVLQDSVKSIASVQLRSSRDPKKIREGETILGKIKIDKIDRQKLIVKNLTTGECESIENETANRRRRKSPIAVLSPKKSQEYKQQLKQIEGIKNDGNNFMIEKSFLKSKLSDINSLLTQARGIPIRNPDGTLSFKIVDIEPGGVFAHLGVQNNDVISQINGQNIKNMNQIMNFFGKIQNMSKLNLLIQRSGEEVQQNYTIK